MYYVNMEIRDNNNICIITPLSTRLDGRKTDKIIARLLNEQRVVGLDLSYVQDCTIDFIDAIKGLIDKNLGVFNINSDMFVLFNMMNLDKCVMLFVTESDFEHGARQLINRKFSLLQKKA